MDKKKTTSTTRTKKTARQKHEASARFAATIMTAARAERWRDRVEAALLHASGPGAVSDVKKSDKYRKNEKELMHAYGRAANQLLALAKPNGLPQAFLEGVLLWCTELALLCCDMGEEHGIKPPFDPETEIAAHSAAVA